MNKLLKSVILIALTAVGVILKGWVLSKIWIWFIVSTFGTAPLRLVEAIGLSIFVTLLTYKHNRQTQEEDDEQNKNLPDTIYNALKSMVLVLYLLLIGYIVHLFY